MGTPTWTHGGIVCVAAPFKDKVKVTFPHGASLPDPKKLFNAGREGNSWRAIDIFEKDVFNESAFKELFRSGIAYNLKGKASAPKPTKKGN